MSAAGPTRRALLRSASAGVGGAAAVAIGACGSSASKTHTSSTIAANPGPDVPILNRALDLEHMAIHAYTAVAPLLGGSSHLAAQRFLAQEIAHAGELAGLVKQDGGIPVKPRASYDLGRPGASEDLLRLLYRVEQAQIAVYVQAIPLLSKPSSRAAIAAIAANDAQHAAFIQLARDRNPVPSAFVRGAR